MFALDDFRIENYTCYDESKDFAEWVYNFDETKKDFENLIKTLRKDFQLFIDNEVITTENQEDFIDIEESIYFLEKWHDDYKEVKNFDWDEFFKDLF